MLFDIVSPIFGYPFKSSKKVVLNIARRSDDTHSKIPPNLTKNGRFLAKT